MLRYNIVYVFCVFCLIHCGCRSKSEISDGSRGELSTIQKNDLIHDPLEARKFERPSPPKQTTYNKGNLQYTITYGSPSVRGRAIWGQLVPYSRVWRAGANEATVFSFSKNVLVNGKKLKAGQYSFFVEPRENGEWIAIFNNDDRQWGAYEYNSVEDAERFVLAVNTHSDFHESLKYSVQEVGSFASQVVFNWEKIAFHFSVELAE